MISRSVSAGINMKERKAVAIVIVWGVLIMLSMLAITALRLMGNQGFLTESSVRRTKAYYTAKAAMVAQFESCRKDGCSPPLSKLTLNNLSADILVTPGITDSFCNGCARIETVVDY